MLRCNDENFIDFLLGCFQWNPEDRMTPDEALKHEFILEGLPDNIKRNFVGKKSKSVSQSQTIIKNTLSKRILPPIDNDFK